MSKMFSFLLVIVVVTGCPAGYDQFDPVTKTKSKCLKVVCDDYITAIEAQAACVADQGQLATPTSAEMNQHLGDKRFIDGNKDYDMWIGVHDETGDNTWLTMANTPVTYLNWYWGQPDPDGHGMCAFMRAGELESVPGWVDNSCTNTRYCYACESVALNESGAEGGAESGAEVSESGDCPSSQCWSYTTEDGCTLKDNGDDCSYTLTCGAEGIDIAFGEHLFGGAALSDFSSQKCLTEDGSGFKWGGPLGSCSEIITSDDGKIVFEQTIGTTARTGTEIGGTTVYTRAEGSVSITFTCKYDATASATSDDIDVTQPLDVTGNVVEIDGNFDGGLSLKFYKSSEYAEENTAPQVIGSKLYPMVSWSVTTLKDKVGFFIQSCTVVDVGPTASIGIKIVHNSCYAKVVSAKLISDKFVYDKSKMEYNSFSYDTTEENTQKLECQIQFCVVKNTVPDCGGIVSQAEDCPSNAAIYEYTHNGE